MCKHKPGTGRCSGNSMTVSCSVSTPPCPDQNSNMPLEGSSSCNKETTTAERSAAETSNFFLSSANNNESMCSKELKSSSLSDKNVNGFINNSEQTSASTNAWFNSQETKTLELKPSESTSSYRTNDGASHVIPSIPLWSIREEKEGIDFNKMECSGSTDLRAVSTPDIPCGSEESLLPNSDISTPLRNKKEQGIVSKVYLESPPLRLVGYDPSEIDLIRFSPSDYSNKESNENEHLLSSGESGSCMFRCSDDIGSDDEGNNTIDNDCESLVIQNYNFTPIVTMISHDNDNRQCATPAPDESSDLFLDVFFPKRLGLPQVKSAAEISVASSVSQKSLPICRICHLPASEDDTLISPCRCSGTMQYIHNGCLLVRLLPVTKDNMKSVSTKTTTYVF